MGRAVAPAANDSACVSLLEREVLAPLGMRNATFDTAAAAAAAAVAAAQPDGGAVNLSAACTPAPGMPGSWLAPCGCLWASADDHLARLIEPFSRNGAPDDDGKEQALHACMHTNCTGARARSRSATA